MRTIIGWTGMLLLVYGTPAAAQRSQGPIRLGVSVGTTSFGKAAEPIAVGNDKLQAMPYRTTMWGVTGSYGTGKVRVGLSATTGRPGLALRGNPTATPEEEGDALLIAGDNVFRLVSVSATASLSLTEFSAGPSLRPSLGLLLERWSSPGAPTQTITGGQAGMALEIPLTRSLSGRLLGEIGYTPGSPFHDEVVPEGFRPRSAWRRTLTGGVTLRL